MYAWRAQKVSYRKVLEDDGKGKQRVEVEQLARWRFLWFSGKFSTRLYVFQDRRSGTVRSIRPYFSFEQQGMVSGLLSLSSQQRWTALAFHSSM